MRKARQARILSRALCCPGADCGRLRLHTSATPHGKRIRQPSNTHGSLHRRPATATTAPHPQQPRSTLPPQRARPAVSRACPPARGSNVRFCRRGSQPAGSATQYVCFQASSSPLKCRECLGEDGLAPPSPRRRRARCTTTPPKSQRAGDGIHEPRQRVSPDRCVRVGSGASSRGRVWTAPARPPVLLGSVVAVAAGGVVAQWSLSLLREGGTRPSPRAGASVALGTTASVCIAGERTMLLSAPFAPWLAQCETRITRATDHSCDWTTRCAVAKVNWGGVPACGGGTAAMRYDANVHHEGCLRARFARPPELAAYSGELHAVTPYSIVRTYFSFQWVTTCCPILRSRQAHSRHPAWIMTRPVTV